jgi:hypothetical protein
MFSRKDTSFDLAAEMEKNLRVLAEAEVIAPINKMASAIEYLNRAAEIFDENGLYVEAEIATRLLEVFAAKKGKKKKPSKSKSKSKPAKSSKKPAKKSAPAKKKTDEATKGLDSEKMVDNLKEKGWVFNADDMNSVEDDLNFVLEHGEGCDCSMCMEDGSDMLADDSNFAQQGMPLDNPGWDKDEREQDLARIMEDLDDAEKAGHEMHSGGEFEDELGEDHDAHSEDVSRAPNYFRGPQDR